LPYGDGSNANPHAEMIEGPEAFTRFEETLWRLLSVPHSTIVRRERAYREKVAANPNRRGPKRKTPPAI
jgi:hypothetical protein